MTLKYILPLLVVSIVLNAEINSTIEDGGAVTDSDGLSLKSKDRDGYMPDIITPDYLKSGIYGGLALGVGLVKFETNSLNIDNTPLDVSLIAGYNFNKYLAAESRAMVSVSNDNSIDYKKVSLFLKPKYEVYSGLNLYSLVGVGRVSAKSINSKDTESAKTSIQFGLGADYKLKNNFKLFADYTYLGKDSSAKYKKRSSSLKSAELTAGITYDF